MKLINKFLIGFLAMGMVTLVSCNKGDDDGPSEPEFSGTFTGNLTIVPTATESDWVTSSISAVHDTSMFNFGPKVRIQVQDGSGNTIVIFLTDTVVNPAGYLFSQTTTSYSTFDNSTLETPATTVKDDLTPATTGNIVITDNGKDDGILRGTINSLQWFNVLEDENDQIYAVLQEGSFEVPLTRVGTPVGGGDDSDISATIDGQAFAPDFITTSGLVITGASTSNGASLSLSVPASGVGVGDYSFDQTSSLVLIYSDGSQNTYIATSGTVSFSAYNSSAQTATGTFNATLTNQNTSNTLTLTNGSFEIDN